MYYLILASVFLVFSAAFPFIFPLLLFLFARFVDLILQASTVFGVICWLVAVFLFAVPTVVIQILFSKIKGVMFGYSAKIFRLRMSETEERLIQENVY